MTFVVQKKISVVLLLLVSMWRMCEAQTGVPLLLPDSVSSEDTYFPVSVQTTTIAEKTYHRTQIQSLSTTAQKYILYLHDLQYATVYVQPEAGDRIWAGRTGIMVPTHERTLSKGIVIPGYGYSAQLEISVLPGVQDLIIETTTWIHRDVPTQMRLYTQAQWNYAVLNNHNTSISFHLLILGALAMMALYHFLAFVQHRDRSYLWYVIYIIAISWVLMIESGIFQAYVTVHLPRLNLLYRYLQPHSFTTYIVYWFFLRSFVDLPTLLPRFDSVLLRFLGLLSISVVVFWVLFGLNTLYQFTDLTWLTFVVPMSALVFGVGCYFPIIKARNELVNLFVLGSLVLLFGVFVNSVLSAAIEYRWVESLPFAPFYLIELAVVVEVLVFALVVGYRFRKIDYERRQIKELDNLKTTFFANISHEFRTPLTIISGLAGQMSAHEAEAAIIQRNSDSLLLLVNRLLQLSKLDAGQWKMHYITTDIVAYLRYLMESFHSLAQQKEISLTFESASEQLLMDIDEMSMQQIVGNLLSNAIKYTPNGGQIGLRIQTVAIRGEKMLQIEVSDTGIGIAKDEIDRIFTRYYQTEKGGKQQRNSSGIGLAITKEWVEMAKGQIKLQSTEGVGSKFSIFLPIKVSQNYSVPEQSMYGLALEDLSHRKAPPNSLEADTSPEQQQLLLIEDNPDIVLYISKLLDKQYQISVANDGQAGIQMAFQMMPDIIISDVMMPEKDGYEVCDTLKQDLRTSHIPIILLTAKAAQEDKLLGLRRGADAYLVKPFDPEELYVRLENLLELRKNLQARYATIHTSAEPEGAPGRAPTLDDLFLEKVRQTTESIMDEAENTLAKLANTLHLSQMQLYRKIKALTGLTPSLYIRSVRLQKAMELLKTTDLTVSEIAFQVGFNDPAYFSRAFSEAFGHPPSTLRN